MRRLVYKIACLVLTLTCGVTAVQVKKSIFSRIISPVTAKASGHIVALEQEPPKPPAAEPESPSQFYLSEPRWNYNGYVIEEKSRRARLDYFEETQGSPRWVDVSYIVIKKGTKVLGRFDADVYFGLGNSVDFALYPFLGGETRQLFISQDISRGGRQWIVSLAPRFRIIFDGYKYAVGREGYDLGAIDLDKDGNL